MMINKRMVYDKISAVLTDYENKEATEKDLYKMLVSIQNQWEMITGDVEWWLNY